MTHVVKFLIGVLTGLVLLVVLTPVRIPLIDWPLVFLLTLVGPILLPLIFIFLPSRHKAFGASLILIGIAFLTVPVGMSGALDGFSGVLSDAEVKDQAEAASKALVEHGMGLAKTAIAGLALILGGLLFLGGITVWRSTERNGLLASGEA